MITESLKSQIEQQKLKCPLCNQDLEVFYQRRQQLWCVLHARCGDCKARWVEFSRSDPKDQGGTPEQALERTRERIRAYQERLSQQQIQNT